MIKVIQADITTLAVDAIVNAATAEFPSRMKMDRCPWCGIALKDGVCPKCGYHRKEGD